MGEPPICAPIEGIAPYIVPYVLRAAMAARYAEGGSLSIDEAFAAAIATWDTEWADDPAPRTIELAIQAADDDLECWDDDE